jgi:hypothetical protein
MTWVQHFFSPPWLRRIVWELPGLVVIAVVTLAYWFLAPTYLLGGDNGEFALLSRLAGVAHPPGYPLYVAYLRLMHWLPGSGVQSAARATAMLGVAQLVLLYVAARVWRNPPLPVALTLGGLAISPLAMTLHTQAEVFALNGVFAAGLLVLACPYQRRWPILRLCATAAWMGLALCHHHTIVLLAPLVLFSIATALQDLRRPKRVYCFLIAVFVFCVALLPNILLIDWSLRAGNSLYSWGEINSISQLLQHLMRRDFGSFRLTPHDLPVDYWGQQKMLVSSLLWCWMGLLPFALIGFSYGLRSRLWGARLWWGWLSLLLSFLMAGPIFVLMFNIQLSPPAPEVIQRFHYLPVLLLVVPVSSGISCFIRLCRHALFNRIAKLRGMLGATKSWVSPPFMLVAGGLPLLWMGLAFSVSQDQYYRRHGREVHDLVENIFVGLPVGSVVVVMGDHKTFGAPYLQLVEKRRPDVLVISGSMLNFSWYRRRSAAALGIPGSQKFKIERMLALLNGQKRPIFVDWRFVDRLPKSTKTYQYGIHRRVLLSGEVMPSANDLLAINNNIFSAYILSGCPHLGGDGWQAVSVEDYVMAWASLSVDLGRQGRSDLSKYAVRKAESYASRHSRKCDDGISVSR